MSAESGFWKTIWMERLSAVGRAVDCGASAWSSSSMLPPASGLSMPRIVLASVDLPEPDSPTSPSVSPSNSSRSTLTSAGTSWPLWWNVLETSVEASATSPWTVSWPADRRRLDHLAEPVDVVAAGPAAVPELDDRRHDRAAQVGRASGQRSTKTQVGRSVPICGRLPGIVDSARSRLADAVARERAQEAERVRVLRAREDGRGVALLDDLARVHHPDPVAQRPDDAEVVGDEQDRGVRLGLERADEVEDARLDRRVEAGRRLVEDEQLRVGGERDGDDDALLHAARELVRVALGDRSGSAIWTRCSALSALALACFADWPRTVKASATCGPTLVVGLRAAPGSW